MPKANTVTVISPYSAPSIWFPSAWQIVNFPNENRLNSAWLGVVAPLLMLPGRLWYEFALPLLRGGNPLWLLKHLLIGIPLTTLIWLVWGLMGEAYAVPATLDQMANAVVLDPAKSLVALTLDLPQIEEVEVNSDRAQNA